MHRIGYVQKRALVAGLAVLGIDPGKEKHVGQLLNPEGLPLGKAFTVPVSHAGYTETLWKELATRLPAHDPAHLVIAIETACNLWNTLAAYLHDQGYTVLLVSPLTTHHARPLHNHDFSRTDPRDAFLIAEQAYRGHFDAYRVFDDQLETMHQLSLAYYKLAKDKQRVRQRLRSLMEMYFPEYLQAFDLESKTSLYLLERAFLPHHFLEMDLQTEARQIGARSRQKHGLKTLQRLQAWAATSIGVPARPREEALRLVLDGWLAELRTLHAQIAQLQKVLIQQAQSLPVFQILVSIPNLAPWLVALFIAECRGLDANTHYKQIEKFAGTNLRLADSGNYNGPRRISRLGNRRLRKVLFQMTVQTAKVVPQVRRRFLQRQLQKGAYRKSIIAASSQLLRLIHALIKENRIYQPVRKWNRQLAPLEKAYAEKKAAAKRRAAA